MNYEGILLVIGLLLITLNELTVEREATKVVKEYIPRDLDAWFKDPENQPLYMYTSTMFGDNIRV